MFTQNKKILRIASVTNLLVNSEKNRALCRCPRMHDEPRDPFNLYKN